MTRLTRAYYHYEELEEYHNGMWRILTGEKRKIAIAAAADLMKVPSAFEAAMMRALAEWPKSCRQWLTIESANRIAWLGHAGCCIGASSPEEATRAGWHTLSPTEQALANEAAARVLREWERNNSERDLLNWWQGC